MNNLIQQLESTLTFNLSPYNRHKNILVNIRIELLNIKLQAVPGSGLILLQCHHDPPCCSVYTAAFYAGKRVCSEHVHPDGLELQHDSPVNNSVRIVWQAINLSLLWLVYLEYLIATGPVLASAEQLMQTKYVAVTAAVVNLHAIGRLLALASHLVSLLQVLHRNDLLKNVVNSLHLSALIRAKPSLLTSITLIIVIFCQEAWSMGIDYFLMLS